MTLRTQPYETPDSQPPVTLVEDPPRIHPPSHLNNDCENKLPPPYVRIQLNHIALRGHPSPE